MRKKNWLGLTGIISEIGCMTVCLVHWLFDCVFSAIGCKLGCIILFILYSLQFLSQGHLCGRGKNGGVVGIVVVGVVGVSILF